MPNPIDKQLAELPNLNKDDLNELWKQLFALPPQPQIRRDLMISILAHRLQEKAFGGLSASVRARLRRLAKTFEASPDAPVSPLPRLKPGTRLVREWRGQVHLVGVEPNGYDYRGTRYQSLSEVARVITGTRWSGPAFFGIEANPHHNKEGQ